MKWIGFSCPFNFNGRISIEGEGMKKVSSVILVLMLVACATTGNYEKILQTWMGLSESRLVAAWGPPTSVYNLPDGGKMLTYMYPGGTRSSSQYNAITHSVDTTTYWCKTTMTINSSGIITNWMWKGNSCKA